jgi:hypothetical protein
LKLQPDLSGVILDALGDLSLDGDSYFEAQREIMKLIGSAKPTNIPGMVAFVLDGVTAASTKKVSVRYL